MLKAFFASLFALWVSLAAAQAEFTVNDLGGFSVGGAAGPASVSFVGCTQNVVDGATFTFTDHATGTAGARKTIVGVGGNDSATDWSYSSMTVGGVAATEVAGTDTANAGSLVQSAFYIIDNPSGTTATIVVTPSEAVTYMAVCVWAAYDVVSETPNDVAAVFSTNSSSMDVSLDVPADGFGVGMYAHQSGTATVTWTGMTERADIRTSGEAGVSAADTATAGTPFSATADGSGTVDSVASTASFR